MADHGAKVSFDNKVSFEDRVSSDDACMSEKISIEPDLGDQRKSIYKPLPAPPRTPKRVLKKYRVSALAPCVLAVASFVLTLVVVLAGQTKDTFDQHYLIAVGQNAEHFAQFRAEHT
jgi:hypothetical protein